MDTSKYFLKDYAKCKCDCWTLIQDIFRDEYNIKLPDYPVAINTKKEEQNFVEYIFSNIILEEIPEPQAGALAYYKFLGNHHIGYCLDNKKYIHRIMNGTKVQEIPKRAKFYMVKGFRCSAEM